MILITDYASQVRDMMSLAKSLDVPGNNDGIYTIPVKHADALKLATKINEILGVSAAAAAEAAAAAREAAAKAAVRHTGGATMAAATPSKMLVDERTNTLIVVSSEAGYLRVKALVERLDIALDTEGGASIHVYPLENALAEELAATLNERARARRSADGGGAPGKRRPPARRGRAGSTGGDLGSSLEGPVRVIGDKPTNSLIVMSSGRDFLAVRDVIRQLDQPRRQVFIEALILEVQIIKALDIGTSSHGGLPVGAATRSSSVACRRRRSSRSTRRRSPR